jgi:hypothetical protein
MFVCYSGDPSRVDDTLAPIRALKDPVIDILQEQPYVDVQSYLDATEPKGHHYYWKTQYAAELSDDLLLAMRVLFAECPIPEGQLGFLHLGGALNDREWDDGAVGNRDARFVWGVNGSWEPDAPDAEAFQEWVRDAWKRIQPYSTGGNYVNFQLAEDGLARTAEAYGKNYERLRHVKAIYDPGNLFRVNRNIPPAPPVRP